MSPASQPTTDPHELEAVAASVAGASAELIRRNIGRATGLAAKSSPTDVVTRTDLDAEELIRGSSPTPRPGRRARRGGRADPDAGGRRRDQAAVGGRPARRHRQLPLRAAGRRRQHRRRASTVTSSPAPSSTCSGTRPSPPRPARGARADGRPISRLGLPDAGAGARLDRVLLPRRHSRPARRHRALTASRWHATSAASGRLRCSCAGSRPVGPTPTSSVTSRSGTTPPARSSRTRLAPSPSCPARRTTISFSSSSPAVFEELRAVVERRSAPDAQPHR